MLVCGLEFICDEHLDRIDDYIKFKLNRPECTTFSWEKILRVDNPAELSELTIYYFCLYCYLLVVYVFIWFDSLF